MMNYGERCLGAHRYGIHSFLIVDTDPGSSGRADRRTKRFGFPEAPHIDYLNRITGSQRSVRLNH
jgi:hypothetical protein